MKTKFVMVKCSVTKVDQVADEIVQNVHVAEVYTMPGEFDLLVKCNLNDDTDLRQFVTGEIRSIKGVKDTNTLDTQKLFS